MSIQTLLSCRVESIVDVPNDSIHANAFPRLFVPQLIHVSDSWLAFQSAFPQVLFLCLKPHGRPESKLLDGKICHEAIAMSRRDAEQAVPYSIVRSRSAVVKY